MGERHVGFWLGFAAVIAGLVMVLFLTDRDVFALGGCGLVVVGAMMMAISFEDSPAE